MKTHYIIAVKTFDDYWCNTPCGLGDSYDKGFELPTTNKKKVTCKKCKKII